MDESRKVWVGGVNVGISNWNRLVTEVRGLKLKNDDKIADEPLKRVKKNVFVPKSKEAEYRKVLLKEFKNAP